MKITKAELIAIGITLILLAFTAGFFLGRNTVSGSVVIEAAAPETSAYVQPTEEVSAQPTAETSPEASSAQNASAEAADDIQTTASEAEPAIWTPDSGEKLDLNQATQEELENLPDIGPVLAERIIEYRSGIGAFQTLEELKNVDGIGDKTYSEISKYLKVDDNHENSGS